MSLHQDQIEAEMPIEWRCFHCGDVFTDRDEAREHFGETLDDEPICQVTAERYRAVERELQTFQNEADATSKTFYDIGHRAAIAERDAEQKGYDRGIADAKAHPYELGLVPATMRNQTSERVQELLEANNLLLERARKAEEGWRQAHKRASSAEDDASRLRFPDTTGQ